MGYFLRHGLAVLALPATVVLLIPIWLAQVFSIRPAQPQSFLGWTASLVGIAVFAAGSLLFIASLRRFGGEGCGTLAPWDPPKNLVIRGPYAYVRNPMISGVFLILVSEGLLLRSSVHLAWAMVFGLINALYIPFREEPGLIARFGTEFEVYARHVPRLIPRLTPWRGS